MTYLWIALGSALGGMARYGGGLLAARFWEGALPLGTILINIIGSFIIGFFGTLTGPDGRLLVPPDARAFVMVGVCGGFTTFSSFSLQTLELAQKGAWLEAGANVIVSVTLCLVAVWMGHSAAAFLNQLKGA